MESSDSNDGTAAVSFGRMLKQYRVAASLTEEELAEQAGLSVRGISDLERGAKTRPHRETVSLLVRALGLTEEQRNALEGTISRRRHPLTPRSARLFTVLIADIRGYTAFTEEHGDEAGAELAHRFAVVVNEGVEAYDGELIELRGDEAPAVFDSARSALRAAIGLQGQFAREIVRDPSLPLEVGIGVDTGEVIPVQGGYRGAVLNFAGCRVLPGKSPTLCKGSSQRRPRQRPPQPWLCCSRAGG
ncbi:MAG: helix-turn-helix domain-containing protein [Chloroflexota bacterium]|nr:MAG: hypothetical protein DLM70_14005 [Chloroflexota bacterium]